MNDHDEVCEQADATPDDPGTARGHDAARPAHGGETPPHERNDLRGTAVALAARLAAHHRVRRTLFSWMHPARRVALPYAARLSEFDGARAAALAEAFLIGAGFAIPALAHFESADAALALLPSPAVLAVFRLRALLDHVGEVQGWIDRPRRAQLAAWVGTDGARLLLTRRRELGAASSLSAHGARTPALDEQAGDALAWRGLRLFERECGWGPDAPLVMLRLALPEDAADLPLACPVPPPARSSHEPLGAGRHAEPAPSLAIVAQLPALFPEMTW